MKASTFMQSHNIWADSVTNSKLLQCFISRGALRKAKLVHKHILSNGYHLKTFLINTLISMYVKFSLLDNAHKPFDQMPNRIVVSWTTMIAAFAKAGLGYEGLRFLVLMGRDGIRPNMFTYSSVLRACSGLENLKQIHCGIVKDGLDSDVFVRSALVDNYAKWEYSDGDEALNLFKWMKRCGFMADQATLTSVLRACTAKALLELGRQVHVHMLKYNRDLILSNALLDMYCKCGSMEDARFEFSRMVEKDVISWSTMIIGLAQNVFSHEALDIFQLDEAVELIHNMEPEPDVVTWRTLLGACRTKQY
nr:hypothetical protein [Tanacetum cinerariifolium]